MGRVLFQSCIPLIVINCCHCICALGFRTIVQTDTSAHCAVQVTILHFGERQGQKLVENAALAHGLRLGALRARYVQQTPTVCKCLPGAQGEDGQTCELYFAGFYKKGSVCHCVTCAKARIAMCLLIVNIYKTGK